MTRTVVIAAAAAVLAAAIPVSAAGAVTGLSGHHGHALMKRKTARRSSRSTGTGIVTGGKPTATGGTPGGMPDRQ